MHTILQDGFVLGQCHENSVYLPNMLKYHSWWLYDQPPCFEAFWPPHTSDKWSWKIIFSISVKNNDICSAFKKSCLILWCIKEEKTVSPLMRWNPLENGRCKWPWRCVETSGDDWGQSFWETSILSLPSGIPMWHTSIEEVVGLLCFSGFFQDFLACFPFQASPGYPLMYPRKTWFRLLVYTLNSRFAIKHGHLDIVDLVMFHRFPQGLANGPFLGNF